MHIQYGWNDYSKWFCFKYENSDFQTNNSKHILQNLIWVYTVCAGLHDTNTQAKYGKTFFSIRNIIFHGSR